jgi:SAM-dependent methyltransferase
MSEDRRALPAATDGTGTETVSGQVPRDATNARRRLTLRIPDDEVARPQSVAADPTPKPEVAQPPPAVEAMPLMPMRIITISDAPSSARTTDDGGGRMPPAGSDDDASEPLTPRVLVALEVMEEEEEEGVDVRFEDDLPAPRVEVVLVEAPDTASELPEVAAPAAESPAVDLGLKVTVAVPADPDPARRLRPSEVPDDVAVAVDDEVVTLEPPPVRPSASVLPPVRPRLASQPPMPPPSPSKRPVPSAGPATTPASPASPRPPLVIVPPHVGSMPGAASEFAAQKRKARLWWEDLFNDDYIRTAEKITGDQIAREAAFIEDSLGVEQGGVLLDLACGTGRHAIDLARRGYEVVGLDLSLAMLARAGEEAQDRATKLNFVQGDMREMTFEEQFDGVYCWNTSFGYFEEDKNAQVIERVHKALKAGGQFLLDVINRDFLIRQSPSLAWFEGDGCVCMDESCIDFITSRLKVKRTLMLDDGRSREIEYSMRIYSLHELGRILHDQGFKVREVSGRPTTPGVFFGNESPRAIILAEKR